jgi:hypothetical protein
MSEYGFLMSNGSRIDNLTLHKIGKVENLEPFGAVYVDKRYIMSFGGQLLPSNELFPSDSLHPNDAVTTSGVGLPKGAIVIDFAFGEPAFSTISDIVMGYITEVNNEVVQISREGLELGKLLLENRDSLLTEDGYSNLAVTVTTEATLSKTFRGNKFRDVKIITPVYTEGSITTLKQYEKVRVTFAGTGNIYIYDEDTRLLATQYLASVRKVSEWVYIPVQYNKAYGIQIKIEGNLIVDSIRWIWTPSEAQ